MNNENFFKLHRDILSTIPVAIQSSDRQAFQNFLEDAVNHVSFLGDEYRDMVVLTYDRFYRRLPLANVDYRHQKALKSTAVHIFYNWIRPLTPLANAPIIIDESESEDAQPDIPDPVADLEITPVSIHLPSPPVSDASLNESTSSASSGPPSLEELRATSTPIPSPDH